MLSIRSGEKPESHTCCTPIVQLRFGNVRVQVIPEIERCVERLTFFLSDAEVEIAARNWVESIPKTFFVDETEKQQQQQQQQSSTLMSDLVENTIYYSKKK